MRRVLLSICLVSFGAIAAFAGNAGISSIEHSKGWICAPGKDVGTVQVAVQGDAGTAVKVRAELRKIDNKLVWSGDQDVKLGGGKAQVSFKPYAKDCQPGDHSLRVSVLDGGKVVDCRERALMLAEKGDMVLLFDQKPVARGMKFNNHCVTPKEVTVRGAKAWVHQMTYGSQQGGEGWWRSVLMTLADEKCRNGKRPVADIEVVYRHEANAPVELAVDTRDGSKVAAKGWGRNPNWQVLKATLSNARFSAPKTGLPPKKQPAVNCDLRFNACTKDGEIRSVRVHAPDTKNPSDWSRFLEIKKFSSENGWVLKPGSSDKVTVRVQNKATGDWKGVLRLEVCNASGRVESAQEQALDVPPQSSKTVTMGIKVSDEVGERLLRWRLLRGPKNNRRQSNGYEHSLMVAGPEYAFILFEKEPIARGMEFVRKSVAPKEIMTGGLKRYIWRLNYQSSELGWWRSMRMNFTDPAFRNGAAPVVDVDVRFRQRAEAPVTLTADRREDNGACANGWGGRGPSYVKDPPMKSLTAQIDDGVFARTTRDGKQPENGAQGCDLRFNACSVDGEIRSILVKRYDMKKNVDWSRMLRHLGVDLGRTNFVFEPGTMVNAKIKLANRARVPYKENAKVTLSTAYDKQLWSKDMVTDISPEGEGALTIPIDTKGFPYGVYVLRTKIGEHVKTETLFAVSDMTPIPKAKDGDFFYGSDVGGTYKESYKLDWADFMGLDMVRNCTRGPNQQSKEDLTAAIKELRRRGLRGHLIMDPAWHNDAGERAKRSQKICEFLRWAAETHGDFLYWYEMGNEPDLPFFYAGPTDAYVEGYKDMYKAIKSKDKDSVVMNGGLCFHGRDGWRRAHEIVNKIPDNMIDAWAYHGHGPGARAERNAWNRQVKAVREAGKKQKTCIETESGLFANDPATWRRQAQTIVEKVVFAQSKGAPTFFWFNIHMYGGDWGYTTVEREHEPRPAVLAHRTMARQLKGLKHSGELDLLASNSEAHYFAAPDGRRALVLWSDRGEITRTFAIGPNCTNVREVDLYGNARKASEAAPGLVQVCIAADPVFVTWNAGDKEYKVSVPAPPLALPDKLYVVPGRPACLPIVLRNPTGQALDTKVRFATVGQAPVKVTASPAVTIPAKGEKKIAADVTVASVEPSVWPRQWTVFLPVPGTVDMRTFKDIPQQIQASGKTIKPKVGLPNGSDLDLGRLNGSFSEKKQALCFAWIESDRERELEIGAAADWWMEWFINGKRVYSTMDQGNKAPYTVLAHVFKAKLKKGRNLIAVKVLSGSGGWRLVAGGPDEVAAARRERAGEKDALRVEVMVGDKLLAREPVPVQVLRPVDKISGSPKWEELAIDGQLDQVKNLFDAVPDQTRWHKGDQDFSGNIWVRQKGDKLVIAVQVTDDKRRQGDKCLVRFAYGMELSKPQSLQVKTVHDDVRKRTLYIAEVPVAKVGKDRFAVQVKVEDDDWGELKQYSLWGQGDDPENWFQAWIR